jgi:RNAse (barnase) inhibitor barstar
MAWEIGLIVEPELSEAMADLLARYMPIWIVDTPNNRKCAEIARRAASEIWLPDAVCTTFNSADVNARENSCLGILDMVDLHHPKMAKLNLIGVEDSEPLRRGLMEFGFVPARPTWDDSVAFRRPIATLTGVPELQLDASNWENTNDVYQSLFDALGAPVWHGKNFDALEESIVTGNINAVEVPYKLLICGMRTTTSEVQVFVSKLVNFISDREAEGCPISIQIESKAKFLNPKRTDR